MPDPEADVIALSPTTLLATNRFCLRDLQQRLLAGPEPAAPPTRPQPTVEAKAAEEQRFPNSHWRFYSIRDPIVPAGSRCAVGNKKCLKRPLRPPIPHCPPPDQQQQHQEAPACEMPQRRQGLEAHNPSSGCQLVPDPLLDSAPTRSSRLTHYDSWLQ
ncbi:hypothetical protein C1H46_004723 [Malus baccata]|uniref:Uncharacterized protein n=1 Tax=Malus baccata TaxID=106549 RepID=A0A540NGH8_MALBA|nr:hypothetical protein C1H46_004723 [Malus baccata]